MTNKVNTTSLVIRQTLSADVAREIVSFAYGDKRSPAFARYLRQILPGRDACLRMLETASSRKSGFHDLPEPEEEETEHPHWVYRIQGEIALQAYNCRHCGNYVVSQTMGEFGVDVKILCYCNMWWEDDE